MAKIGETGAHSSSVLVSHSQMLHESRPQPVVARSGGPLLRAALRMALAVVLGVAVLRWLSYAVQILREPNGGFDFFSYYAAALALRDNPAANIYDLHILQLVALAHHAPYPGTAYIYPPLLALLIVPLTALPANVALTVWDVFNLVLWLACLALMADVLRRLLSAAQTQRARPRDRDTRLFLVAVVAFLVLTYDPVAQGIGLGQINVIICFLVLLALVCEQRGWAGLAGAALMVASALKVYPLILLGLYLLRGRWRVIRGAGITLAVLVLGLLLALGLQGLLMTRGFFAAGASEVLLAQNEALLRGPYWIAVLAGARPDTIASILGMLMMVLVASAFVVGILRAAKPPFLFSNGQLRSWLGWLRQGDSPTSADGDIVGVASYCWALCTMVLIAPVSWEHSYTWLLPALVVGFVYLLLLGTGNLRRDILLLTAVAVAFALTTADLPLGFDLVEQFSLGPMILGLPLRPIFMLLRPIGALLLWLVFGWLVLTGYQPAGAGQDKADADETHAHAPPTLTARRLTAVLVGLFGAVVLVRGAIIAVMVLYGASYDPTALLR